MTRVAGVPEELRSLAGALDDAAPELEKTASQLSTASLPEMPPSVAATVTDTLGSVGQRLRGAAVIVQQQGLDVGKRASWLAIAGQGGYLMSVYPPRLPGAWGEPGFDLPDYGPFPGLPEEPDLPDYGPFPGFPEGPDLPDYGPFPGLPEGPQLPDYGPLPGPGGGPLPGFGAPGLPGGPELPDYGSHPGHEGGGVPPMIPLPTPTWPNTLNSEDGEGSGGETEDGDGEQPKPDIKDPDSFIGMDPKEVPNHLPPSYDNEGEDTKGEGGTRYPDKERRGDQVRVMPGKPTDPNPVKQGPYMRISRDGQVSDPIPLEGNPTLGPAA